jgi:hypothetical protein
MIDHSVLCSLHDHLGTRTCDLYHPIVCSVLFLWVFRWFPHLPSLSPLTMNVWHAMASPSVKPFAMGVLSSSLTTLIALASLRWGGTQAPPSWAQPAVGHQPAEGHDRGLHIEESHMASSGEGALTSSPLGGTSRGLYLLPSQLHHRWRTLQLVRPWRWFFIPSFKAKPNAHSMCAQGSSLHTYRIENGYKITNVTIYNIYYQIMSYKRLSQTLSEAL